MDALKKVFAWQSSHSLEKHNGTYGIDFDYPTNLQPETLDLYYISSERYHEFCGIFDVDSEQPSW